MNCGFLLWKRTADSLHAKYEVSHHLSLAMWHETEKTSAEEILCLPKPTLPRSLVSWVELAIHLRRS